MIYKTLSIIIGILAFILSPSFNSKSKKQDQTDQTKKVTFIENDSDKKIDVLIGEKIFTSYRWPDNVCKPILYPIFTSEGTEITRGYPIKPKTGERADHPHQIGMWLTYGYVDGNDFWGNGSQGLGIRNANGWVIKHLKVDKMSEGTGEGVLVTSESWIETLGKELLKGHTEYHFIAKGLIRIIDRITTLTADDKDVLMPDTKEGEEKRFL